MACYLGEPEDLFWRPSNLMCIPSADYFERTGSNLDYDGKTNRFRATILVTDC